jgi:hypothetical protein
MDGTVLITGLGDLGGWVLELLARCNGVTRIVTTDVREDWGYSKTMTAACGAGQMGYNKRLEFHKLDLYNIDATAELINKVKPDLIYCAASLQSWWVPLLLPTHVAELSELAGIGPLTPGHLALIHKLMLAVKQSGFKTTVLNNCYPDVCNPILAANGLGPDFGSGNSDLVMEDIRQKVSYEYNVPPQEVAVYFYTAHPIDTVAKWKDIPNILKIYVGGNDITDKYDLKKLVKGFATMWGPPKTTTWIAHPRVASSAVKNIMAFINNTNELTNLPGPKGLPGGYTVRVSRKGAEVALPKGITLEQVKKINMDALKFDGVKDITADGTVYFTDECREGVKEWLGADIAQPLKLADVDERAKDVVKLTQGLGKKYGIKLEL